MTRFFTSIPQRISLDENQVFLNSTLDRAVNPIDFGLHVSFTLGKLYEKACQSIQPDSIRPLVSNLPKDILKENEKTPI